MATISISSKLRGKRRAKAIERARKRVKADRLYFISRHGGYFRPKAAGYTADIWAAGIYRGDEVTKYLDVEGLSVIPINDLRARALTDLATAGAAVAALSSLISMMGSKP